MALSKLGTGIVEATLKRYGVPDWMRPYVVAYVKSDPVRAVKRATSFIEVRRRKGEVNGKSVRLPNGVSFDMNAVLHLLNLFYYGESALARIESGWADGQAGIGGADYAKHFAESAELSTKHMRAVRNLIEGLNRKVGKPSEEVVGVFDYIGNVTDPRERIIVVDVLLRDAYAKPFGFVFYKAFYPAAPEFMRMFGKAFGGPDSGSDWGYMEARRIVGGGLMPNGRLEELAEGVLARTCKSINAEMGLARKAGIEAEATLLRDISIAYPLHDLAAMGAGVDVDIEVKRIKRLAEEL